MLPEIVKYVGVVRFDFHVLRLLPSGFTTNKTCVKVVNVQWSASKIGMRLPPYLDMAIGTVCLLNPYLNTYIRGPPLCSLLHVGCLLVFQDVVQFHCKYVSLCCLFFDPHQGHTPINYRRPIKKSNRTTCTSHTTINYTPPVKKNKRTPFVYLDRIGPVQWVPTWVVKKTNKNLAF